MSALIRMKLRSLRVKQTLVALGTGSSMAVVSLLLALAATMLLDWLLDFPWLLRAVLLAGNLAALGYIVRREAIHPIARGTDEESLALLAERHNPSFATRLIAAVQFSQTEALPAGVSPALVGAMIRQTEEMAEPVDFTAMVPVQRLRTYGTAAGALLVGALLLGMFAGHIAGPLLLRALLFNVPLPTRTHLETLTGNTAVARGEAITLAIGVSGWHPATGRAEITYASGRKQTILVEPSKNDPNIYSGILDTVPEDFHYQMKIYDARSETYSVEAIPAPTVVSLQVQQTYPAYTGLGTQPRAPSDLLILMGSQLQLTITASKDCRYVTGPVISHLHLYGPPENQADMPLKVDPTNPRMLTATITPPDTTTGFSINLVDQRGVHSQDPAIYRVDMIPDLAPQVRIWRPDRKEILVTVASNPLVGFTAEDDYGLGNIVLHYKVDDNDVQTVAIPYEQNDSTGHRRRTLKALYRWPMAAIAVPAGKTSLEGSVLEYWIECFDSKAPTPNSATTEHYQARVVTAAEKQAELLSRLNESLGNITHIADDQTSANEDLGAVVIEAAPGK